MQKIETATQAKKIIEILQPMRTELRRAETAAGCENPNQAVNRSVNYDMEKLNPMFDALEALIGAHGVFGNKGRNWGRTGCLTGLDHIKGQCNPRLSFNSCGVEHIGCPKCLEALHDLADPNWREDVGELEEMFNLD